jgi:beta-lactamase regulating signal transducer with metallopeptidase domain
MNGILSLQVLKSLNQGSATVIAAILNSFWQAAGLLAVAWLIMRFTPRMNAATRHVLWWALLGVVATLPVAPRVASLFEARPTAAISVEAVATEMELPAATPVRPPAPARIPSAPLEVYGGFWPCAIFAFWAAVLAMQLARIGWSYGYLRRIKHQARPACKELRRNFDAWMMSCGVRRPARLLISAEIALPMAVGFRDPAVILPERLLTEFQESEMDHVLLHELAHIARRDDWSNLAARVAQGVFALHPVAAWVLRGIEREREIACDDWVVSMTGEPRPYAASLARLFELCFARRRMMLASGMADNASHLGRRIEMLMRRGAEFAPRASAARIAVGIAALLALVIAGAQAPGWFAFAQEQTPPAAPEAVEAPALPAAPQAPASIVPPPSPASGAPEAAQAPLATEHAKYERQVAELRSQMAELSETLTARHPRMQRLQQQLAALEAPLPAPLPQAGPPPAPAPAPERGSFLGALSSAGYGNLSVDEIIELKNAGVSADFLRGISETGWGKLTSAELIGLTQRGVRPDYIRKMKDAGLKDLTLKDVMALASVGASADKIREIHSLGFGPYTTAQVIQFSQLAVQPSLFRALKDGGYGNATPGEIMEAAQVGLNPHDLREAKQYGSSLTIKQVVRLKTAGVF